MREEFLTGFPTLPRDLALEALEEASVSPMEHCRLRLSIDG
jgi:hypothetical protein